MDAIARYLWFLLPANPMVVRIVQGGSRRMRHLWVRMGYLGALIMLVLVGLLSADAFGKDTTITDLAKSGTKVFTIVAYGQVILVCLIAPIFMAGAITHERQNETFDILLTTPLSNLQIVLGTLAGRLYFILALLMSGLPLFAVLLIFGGVPVRSVFVAFAVAALSAVMVGSVAVTLSVLRTGGRKAVYFFVIAIVGYLVAAYAADYFIRAANRAPGVTTGGATTFLTPLHPMLVLEASVDQANYRTLAPEELADHGAIARFYLSQPLGTFATLTILMSLTMLVFSALQVRRLTQGIPMIPLPQGLRRLLRLDAGERIRPARVVWHNPIAWREANARGNKVGGILARWGFFVLGIGAAVTLVVLYATNSLPRISSTGGAGPDQGAAFRMALLTLLLLELAVIVIVAIYMSAGSISKEREDGTLDLLLTSPITPHYYIWGKVRGLVSFLSTLIAVPVLTMVIVCVYTMLAGDHAQVAYYRGTGRFDGPLVLPEAMLLLPLLIVPFVALAVTVGIMFSIKASSVLGAVVWSVAGVGGMALVLGFIGANCAANVAVVGPIINAFSPATSVMMLVNPYASVQGFAGSESGGRANLVIAALLAGAGYSAIVYGYLIATVKSFDHTVRKLSGAAN